MKIYKEERPWGVFEQFTHNENSTVKILTVNEGGVSLVCNIMKNERNTGMLFPENQK